MYIHPSVAIDNIAHCLFPLVTSSWNEFQLEYGIGLPSTQIRFLVSGCTRSLSPIQASVPSSLASMLRTDISSSELSNEARELCSSSHKLTASVHFTLLLKYLRYIEVKCGCTTQPKMPQACLLVFCKSIYRLVATCQQVATKLLA